MQATNPIFKLRDRVRVVRWPTVTGTVVALRGRLGPNSEEVYRIRTRGKPNPAYVIVMEYQIELVPPPTATDTDPVAAESK